MFELKQGLHTYDPIKLVHSDLVLPADWGFGPDDFLTECTCEELWNDEPEVYWHACGPYSNSERMLQVFEWKFYSANFRDSIRDKGTNVTPIFIETWGSQYILRNGHHRLMVAYDYGLPVLARVDNDWSYDTDFNSNEVLPWSGDD